MRADRSVRTCFSWAAVSLIGAGLSFAVEAQGPFDLRSILNKAARAAQQKLKEPRSPRTVPTGTPTRSPRGGTSQPADAENVRQTAAAPEPRKRPTERPLLATGPALPPFIVATAATAPVPQAGSGVYYEYPATSGATRGELVVRFEDCPKSYANGDLFTWSGQVRPTGGTISNLSYYKIGDRISCYDRAVRYSFENVPAEQVYRMFAAGDMADLSSSTEALPAKTSWVRLPDAAAFQQIRAREEEKTKPNPNFPTDIDLAVVLARAYYDAQDEQDKKAGVAVYDGQTSAHGVTVAWDVDPKGAINAQYGLDAFREEQIFFVNDEPLPKCAPASAGSYRCTFDIHVETVLHDMIGDVGGFFRDALTNQQNKRPREDQWENRYYAAYVWKRDFSWKPYTATVKKVDGKWTSPGLVQEMRPIAAAVAKRREAVIHQRTVVVDAFSEGVRNANTCLGYAMMGARYLAPPALHC